MYLRERNRDEAALEREAQLRDRIEALERSLSPSPSMEDAQARLDLAWIYVWQCRYHRTLETLQGLTGPPFPEEIAMEARQMVGDAHFRYDQYDLAQKQFQENWEKARANGNEYWMARAKDGLAWILVEVGHFHSGEFVSAANIFEETLPVYRKLGRKFAEAVCVQGLSRAYAGGGDYDLGLKYANEALRMMRESGDERLIQLPLTQIAMIYRDNGSFERSRPYFEQALDAADRNQDPFTQATVALAYGCLLSFTGEKEAAREMWRSVQPMIAELGLHRLGHEINSRLATHAEAKGDFEEAYRSQLLCQRYGNQIGVLTPILQNQQMLLRERIDRVHQLQDSLQLLTAGVEASADAVFVLGAALNSLEPDDFFIHFVNTAGARLVGRPAEELGKMRVREFWRSPGVDRLIQLSVEVFADGAPRSVDPISLNFPSAPDRLFSAKIVRIIDGVAWTICDVTEREALEREIRSQRDRLEVANERLIALDREKSEMLGIAAHDLRSPIANIYSICELIPEQEPETEEYLNLIRGISHSLLGLISNLLDVHKIERGEMNLRIEPIDIPDAIDQIVREMVPRAERKQIEIAVTAKSAAAYALADRASTNQVIENLLSNAVKFSPHGSRVEISSAMGQNRVRIEVRDQGPGLSEADQGKLFGRFARLTAKPTGGEASTGLGLSIVKRLVEAMDGEIGCESTLGEGATFWFEVPRA